MGKNYRYTGEQNDKSKKNFEKIFNEQEKIFSKIRLFLNNMAEITNYSNEIYSNEYEDDLSRDYDEDVKELYDLLIKE
ncbi:17469_t:CDS:1, partial [Gigaspora rosea]